MARPQKKPIKTVAAVERALLVLDAFRKAPGSLSFTDIVSATGLLKTSVFRLLLTLRNAGYVVRLPNDRFQLGAVFMQFAMAYRQSFRLEDHIQPALERLVQATGESASFYVREGEQRLCLLRVDSRQPVRDVVRAGTVQPIDDTAASQVLRECCGTRDVREVVAGDYGRLVKSTIGKGSTPQVASVSAPVFGVEGLLGAMTLSGPRERFVPSAINSMKAHLATEAAGLSDRLSGALNLARLPLSAEDDEQRLPASASGAAAHRSP